MRSTRGVSQVPVSNASSGNTATRYYTFNGATIASRTASAQSLTWLFSAVV